MERYIKTDILAKLVFDKWQECDELKRIIPSIKRAIMCESAIDAVEVVRCKDCEHYKPSEADPNRKMCWRKDVDGFPVCYDFYPTDFCSYGERRDDST